MKQTNKDNKERRKNTGLKRVLPLLLLGLLGITLPLALHPNVTADEYRLLATYDFGNGSYPEGTNGTAAFADQGGYYLHFDEVGQSFRSGPLPAHGKLKVDIHVAGRIIKGPLYLLGSGPVLEIAGLDEAETAAATAGIENEALAAIAEVALQGQFRYCRVTLTDYSYDAANPVAAMSLLVSHIAIYGSGA